MTIEDKTLRKIPLFNGLKEEHFELLKRIIHIKEFDEGDVVIREGETGEEIYILLDGEVEVSKSLVLKLPELNFGHREKSLIKLTSDTYPFFGEMVLFNDKAERTATVIATKRCKFAIIYKNDFVKLTESNREVGCVLYKNIATVLAERLRKANNDILKLTTALTLVLSK
ncbi:MAG: cyclic nucleotide-binding domain-containing protein [Candidatus Kryptonium sp.]|nr:cyclic nucleotide-binding domain-containing protein [Candidatus Kryptonium sp.]MCX7762260.1 cyclic nucleotide-binding domain-containing protein [Candidatus Kryptonium sp.]MDW8109337.1 cyclic nucleotide-binding domain-containing protein [Candidatus Kryptonium sp.]